MDKDHYFEAVDEAAGYLKKRVKTSPEIILVLTGGLEPFLEEVENKFEFDSTEIPHFPKAKAQGHSGKVIFGEYQGKSLAVMKGRYHYYEGLSGAEVVFPYFVFNKMGARKVITTNATGGIRKDLEVGDLLLVTDHINGMGTSPLVGIAVQRPTNQFTSLQDCYDPAFLKIAKKVAISLGITLKEGVYMAVPGPNYETKAEIRAFRGLGADTIGMSSVFAVIAARFLEMRALTFNIITNPAADLHTGILHHDEILEAMKVAQPKMVKLLQAVIPRLV